MKPAIRKETSADHSEIYEVNRIAFGQDNEARLVDLLRKSDVFIPELSLIALVDKNIVGHILFTKLKIIDDRGDEHESLALAPMAVRTDFQKQGIGGHLIRQGLQEAKGLGYRSVIVLGHEHYYPKFGFEPAIKWNIKPPFEVPSEVFMAIELVNNGLKGVTGTVQYPKEFNEV